MHFLSNSRRERSLAAPKYIFLKQSATLRSYFGDLCLDIPRPGVPAAVFSEIEDGRIGNIIFCKGPKYNREAYRTRAFSWLMYLALAFRFVLCVKGDPVLFIVAQPPFLPLVGYLGKKVLGRRYVVWVDDVYPDVLSRRGIIREGGWISRLWGSYNRLVLRNSEHVFTLGPHMLETVRKYMDSDTPATIIPTWVDTDTIQPVPKSENLWAKEHGFQDKFTILYSGNFGQTHDVEFLIEAARRLSWRKEIHFILVGSGEKWKQIRATVDKNADANITVLPWQSSERLSESLSSGDVSFVSLGEGIEGVSMPSKTYSAMAAGSAIIASCTEQSDLAELVRSADCGIVVKPNSIEELAEQIDYLSKTPNVLARFKQNSRSAAVAYYSRKVNARQLRGILEEIAFSDEKKCRKR